MGAVRRTVDRSYFAATISPRLASHSREVLLVRRIIAPYPARGGKIYLYDADTGEKIPDPWVLDSSRETRPAWIDGDSAHHLVTGTVKTTLTIGDGDPELVEVVQSSPHFRRQLQA